MEHLRRRDARPEPGQAEETRPASPVPERTHSQQDDRAAAAADGRRASDRQLVRALLAVEQADQVHRQLLAVVLKTANDDQTVLSVNAAIRPLPTLTVARQHGPPVLHLRMRAPAAEEARRRRSRAARAGSRPTARTVSASRTTGSEQDVMNSSCSTCNAPTWRPIGGP